MTSEQSPIYDWYPLNFETDLNGKMQQWEAVVLLPFIEEVCDFFINLLGLLKRSRDLVFYVLIQ